MLNRREKAGLSNLIGEIKVLEQTTNCNCSCCKDTKKAIQAMKESVKIIGHDSRNHQKRSETDQQHKKTAGP